MVKVMEIKKENRPESYLKMESIVLENCSGISSWREDVG